MRIPHVILIAFVSLVVGGTLVATSLLVSGSEPQLGPAVVLTPIGTPPPASPTTPAPPTPSPTPSPDNGAAIVPQCAPSSDDDACDDDWDDYDEDVELDGD